jgi:Rrf2 family protein
MHTSKFTVALHLLTLIAINADEGGCSFGSKDAACSVNTNPVVIRRILGTLREAGIVESKAGRGGGWTLARSAKQITLADVYQALEQEVTMFGMHSQAPSKTCSVGKNIPEMLRIEYGKAEQAMMKELKKTTVADMAIQIERATA